MVKTKTKNSLKAKKTNKTPIGMLILVFIASITTVFSAMYLFMPRNKTNELVSTLEVRKPATPQPSEKVEDSDSKTPIQNEGEDPNKAPKITGAITSSNITGYTLRIRTNIDQYVSGTCTLNMDYIGNNAATLKTEYRETVDIIDSVSTSTCEGFDINIGPLESGLYKIEINLSANDGRSGVISGEVELP